MDGAASAITVIGLTLNSADLIRKIISNIKNTPEIVQQTSNALGDLSTILRQLYTYSGSLENATDLQELIRRCREDLTKFEKTIGNLISTPRENKRKIFWKTVRAALQEKDIERINGVTRQYLHTFSMQIQLLEATKAAAEAVELQRVKDSVLANTNTLGRTIESTNCIPKELDKSLSEALRKIGDRFDNLDGMSYAQTKTLGSILELLQRLIPTKIENAKEENNEQQQLETTKNIEIEGEQAQSPNKDTYIEALDRLSRIVRDKEGTVFSTEAATIIQDVEQILTSLMNARVCTTLEGDRKGKRKRASTEDQLGADAEPDLQTMQEVKRVKGLLIASHCLDISSKNIPATKSWKTEPGKVYDLKNAHYCYDSLKGSITIRTRRARRLGVNPGFFPTMSTEYQHEWAEILEAYMAVMPKDKRIWFAIRFQQGLSYEGTFLRKPILSFSAVVPSNSAIFKVIKANDLDGLFDLLRFGNASLTDRDPDGRCLLNYALKHGATMICKYLIDNGADVDFVEPDFSGGRGYRHSLTAGLESTYKMLIGKTQECRRLLLQTGADPTVYIPASGESYTYFMLHWYDEDHWRALLKYSSDFIRMNSDGGFGDLLITALEGYIGEVKILSLLCQQGADLKRRSKGGLTSLHLVLLNPYEKLIRKKEYLVLLIKAGADIHAEDDNGYQPSDYAHNIRPFWAHHMHYDPDSQERYWRCFGGRNLLEIWKKALEECGYDAEEVISKANIFGDNFEGSPIAQSPEDGDFNMSQDGSIATGHRRSLSPDSFSSRIAEYQYNEDEAFEISTSAGGLDSCPWPDHSFLDSYNDSSASTDSDGHSAPQQLPTLLGPSGPHIDSSFTDLLPTTSGNSVYDSNNYIDDFMNN